MWSALTVPEIDRRWWDWSRSQQGVMWEVVASTEDPDTDEDFQRLEQVTENAPSPMFPENLASGG